MTLARDYWHMVKAWRAILVKPLSDAEKTDACFAILRSYIDELARARVRQPNPPLRFFADMLELRCHLQPGLGADIPSPLIIPLFHAVDDWVREHREPFSGSRESD